MITREQYLEDIVETYTSNCVFGRSLKGNDLQIGDKSYFQRQMSKDVLPEKEYEVVWIDSRLW